MPDVNGDAAEPRVIIETGTEARIARIVEPVAAGLGFRLVRVKLSAMNGTTLQIMAERPDGTMTVGDCETLSRDVSPALDVEDPMDAAYNLEVSSPGIDRPLTAREDFARFAGYEARVELAHGVEGRRRFKGLLIGLEGSDILMDVTDENDNRRVRLPVGDVAEAKLLLTDRLIQESLKARKAKDELGEANASH